MKLKDIRNILFLDIETVSAYSQYHEVSSKGQSLWAKKAMNLLKSKEPLLVEEAAIAYRQKAGIFSEFAKVVCISVAFVTIKKKRIEGIKFKSFYGHDEKIILVEFIELLNNYYNNPKRHFICGHNIKEFDIPFLCRRMLVNNLPLPQLLNIRAKKPWQVSYLLDTMELWRFGDYKNYTSLDLLAETLDVPSSKDLLEGSLVGQTYWEENDVELIKAYCQKDVEATILVFLRMFNIDISHMSLIEKESLS